MDDRYGVLTLSNRGAGIIKYIVVDENACPKPVNYKTMPDHAFVAEFPIHARISQDEALKSANEYCIYLNKKEDAIRTAAALIGL